MKKSFLVAFLLLSACQPYSTNIRGNVLINEHMKEFVVGRTTAQEVYEKCGSPSLYKSETCWLYIGAVSEESSFKKNKLRDRSVVKVTFNANGILKAIEEVDLPKDDSIQFDKESEPLVNEK